MPRQTNIQIRRGTASDWASVNPTLAAGEIAMENDTKKIKVGDGSTAWNSLRYVGADGGDLEGGDGGDNSCPAPLMRILMEDGSLLAAGDLKQGMRVRTRHETTMKEGSHEVSHVSVVLADRVSFRIGDVVFICSLSHKFHTGSGWVEAKNLDVGDELAGQKVSSKEEIGPGEVVKITVDGAHTYVCEGLLSHNKGELPTTTTAAPTTTTAAPTTTTTTTTTTTAPGGVECCGSNNINLSGSGIPSTINIDGSPAPSNAAGCYTWSGGGWFLDSRVYDNDPESPNYGNRTEGSVYYAYMSGSGVLSVYEFMSFQFWIYIQLVDGPSENDCPITGTHPTTAEGNPTVTISCGC